MQVIKKSINHIKNDLKTYSYNKKHFGKEIAKVVFNKSFFYYLLPSKREMLEKKQNNLIYEYLSKKYKYLVDKYNKEEIKYPKCKKKRIWVFWYQGLNNAPMLVKRCIESINKYKLDYEVILLTKNNIKDYIEIPEGILKKVENGIITITHFSDILRMGLLSIHGGIWVDATCLITGDVFKSFDNKTLNTCKNSESLWTGFFMGGKPNKLFSFCYELLIDYNLEENSLIEYFLIDHVINLAYKKVDGCKELIASANIINKDLSYFGNRLNYVYDKKEYERILKECPFHKLTYKKQFKEYDNDKITNYGYFIKTK